MQAVISFQLPLSDAPLALRMGLSRKRYEAQAGTMLTAAASKVTKAWVGHW